MSVKIGDRVLVEAEKVSKPERHGVIEEVLQEEPLRIRVQWDDGHESILSPEGGSMRVQPKRATKGKKRASRTRTSET